LEALLPPDITMMDVQRTGQLRRAHYRAGDVIIRQGEIAQHFFIIESGEVEILREEPGQGDTLLGTRCAGASFGEIALLKSVPRTATVRCLSPVDVVMFSREDFLSLMNSHKQIRGVVEKEVNAIVDRK
jgi:CRP-like cAMP-binding protein